jgi:hypothetical protein
MPSLAALSKSSSTYLSLRALVEQKPFEIEYSYWRHKDMKLSYRGVNYDEAPSTLEVTEGEIGGMYRGQKWRYHYPRHVATPLPIHNLKYRGVPYGSDQLIATTPAKTGIIRNEREQILDEWTNLHLQNIRRSLEHRLQVAKANGDQNLIRLLEAEFKQMALPL